MTTTLTAPTTLDAMLVAFDRGEVGAKSPELAALREAGYVDPKRIRWTAAGKLALANIPPAPPVAPAADEAPIVLDTPTETVCVPTVEPLIYEGASEYERYVAFKTERAALNAWKADPAGDAPETPWLNTYGLKVAHDGKLPGAPKTTGTGKGRSNFTPEAMTDVLAKIVKLRDEGKGWPTIAKLFNDADGEYGTPTAKGGSWASSTVLGIAKRHGIPTTGPATVAA